jgi:PknH-like extracellular domain
MQSGTDSAPHTRTPPSHGTGQPSAGSGCYFRCEAEGEATAAAYFSGMSSADESHDPPRSDNRSAAAELARRLLLSSADLPGFVSYSAEVSSASDDVAARCAGVQFEPLAQAHSDSYSGRDSAGTDLSVVSAVTVLPDADQAARFFASYRSTNTLDCIKAAFVQDFAEAGVQAQVSWAVLSDMGHAVFATRFEVQRGDAPEHVEFNDSLVFVRGSALITVGVASMGPPAAAELERHITEVLIDRAARTIP